MFTLDAMLLLRAYAAGIFPMAESADSPGLYWFDPEQRGVMPLDGFHVPRRLRRTVRQGRFEMRFDHDFTGVMQGCAAITGTRTNTWINRDILQLYTDLHTRGHAHSVECWRDGRLVGGLYGVSLGGAFFGESMFSRETDASKVALVHLVARLRAGGYSLLDAQFVTEHLSRFGAVEIPRAEYRRRLAAAQRVQGNFHGIDQDRAVSALLDYGRPEEQGQRDGDQEPPSSQVRTQTS
ncbi:leucyl/phenylalanyl-tRNA--protein transferase [Azospirillum fermentarium]|uniref:leucyl/phenylalanyl-tRNA--protein transferase n=1 Tax=Azospirillum fermentarium TaxID=1233114 RepID=UPI002226B0EF|nr:leucyl/phenylalanyl-tRNA--protein transferase [Azospirillum fermentarium]